MEDILLQDAVETCVGEGQLEERSFAEGAVGRRASAVTQEEVDRRRVPDQGGVVIEEAAVADIEQVADAAQFALDDYGSANASMNVWVQLQPDVVKIDRFFIQDIANTALKFEAVRASGERVVIDGPCFSACTLVLTIIPRNRICVTRRAVFGFHAARAVDEFGREYPAPDVTRAVAAAYPAPIRKWIRLHGGLTRAPIFLSGPELAGMVRRCR